MDVVEDPAQRALLAETLLAEVKPPEASEVQSAIQEIQERAIEGRQRELRSLIAEAERRGDFAELAVLTQQKLDLDRTLRQLHNQRPPRPERTRAHPVVASPKWPNSASNHSLLASNSVEHERWRRSTLPGFEDSSPEPRFPRIFPGTASGLW